MAGMRKVPEGIRRVPASAERPPRWWAVWYMLDDRCVLLGHTRRLEYHLMHRAFPSDGRRSRDIKGWVNAVDWLLECRCPGRAQAPDVEPAHSGS
jgi:hypothetical protein